MAKKQASDPDAGVQLKKEINILQGMGIIIGIIIGSGIFVSPVGVIMYARSVGLSLIIWVFGGLFSILGALVYAELGVRDPRSGGEYTYILSTFGPLPAFMAFWITFFIIGCGSCAANSLVFAQYLLLPFYPNCEVPAAALHVVAILALLTYCFINCYRVTWSTKLSSVCTLCKVAALLLIVVFGVYYLSRGNITSFQDPFEGSANTPGSLALAFYQGFWAFAGWNYLNFLTGEVKNPSRNVPLIIILSLTMVTLIYLLVNVAYLALLSPEEMLLLSERSTAIAVAFADRCMGKFAWVMPIFVGSSVFGSANGEVLAMSRVSFTAGEEGHMPLMTSMVSINNFTPIPSVLLVVVVAILFQLYPDIFYLIELTGLAFTVISAMAVMCLLVIRYRQRNAPWDGFKLPIAIPLIYLLVDVGIGALTVYQSPYKALASLGLMAAAVPVYLVGVSWQRKPDQFLRFMSWLTTFTQKLFAVVPVEKGSKTETLIEDDVDVVDPGHWHSCPSP